MNLIILILCCLLLYQLVKYEQKWVITRKLGAIIISYLIGIILALSFSKYFSFINHFFVVEACLLISLPLLLIDTKISKIKKLSNNYIYAFVLSLVSLLLSAPIAKFIFISNKLNMDKYIGAGTAIYSGGTANLSAYKMVQGLSVDDFNLIFMSDLITGSFYLVLILGFIKFFYKNKNQNESNDDFENINARQIFKWSAYSLVLLFPCILFSFLFFKGLNQIFIIVSLSLFSVFVAQKIDVVNVSKALKSGDYFLILFCFFAGTQLSVDSTLDNFTLMLMLFSALLLCNLLIYSLLCFIFKIPFKEGITAHIATVYGPPFVLVISKSIKDNSVIAPGITIGSIGLAIGTFFGMFIYRLIVLL